MPVFMHIGINAPSLWTPANLGSALLAWYKAETLVGSEGAAVTSWTDSSGNGKHATQATGVCTVHLNDLNSMTTLRCPGGGGNAYLDVPDIYSGKSAASAYAVFKRDLDPPTDVNKNGFWTFGSSASSDHFPWTDSNVYDGFCSTVRKSYGNPSPALTSWRICGWHSAANDHGIHIDGTLFNSTATNTFGATSTPYIGKNATPTYFEGYFAEIILTDSKQSQSDREKVEGYLAHRHALTGNLDSGHPYKNSPPGGGSTAGEPIGLLFLLTKS